MWKFSLAKLIEIDGMSLLEFQQLVIFNLESIYKLKCSTTLRQIDKEVDF